MQVIARAIDEIPITVKPFTLPRFRVEATADKSYYRAGDTPTIATAWPVASTIGA